MQPLRILIVDNAISHRKVMRAAMEEGLAALPGGGITEFATTVEEPQLLPDSEGSHHRLRLQRRPA